MIVTNFGDTLLTLVVELGGLGLAINFIRVLLPQLEEIGPDESNQSSCPRCASARVSH